MPVVDYIDQYRTLHKTNPNYHGYCDSAERAVRSGLLHRRNGAHSGKRSWHGSSEYPESVSEDFLSRFYSLRTRHPSEWRECTRDGEACGLVASETGRTFRFGRPASRTRRSIHLHYLEAAVFLALAI